MSTLLETKSPGTKTAVPASSLVLQSRHQWLRWRGVLIAGVAGLAATLLAIWLIPASWHTGARLPWLAAIWAGGLFITLVAAAVAYRFAPGSLLATAQKLDEDFAAKNRLEASAMLRESASPLAEAQRTETTLYLDRETQARPVRVLPWLAGILLALVAVHFISFVFWLGPLLHPAPAVTVPPPAKEIPKASIVWQSPEPETKANPVEEVPTVAIATSTSGLRDLTLEVSLNGVAQKSTPIPAGPYAKAGNNKIEISLYLDEINAQPFDIVSYYIRGQRISTGKLPDVASAIQFVQVRPFRDDVTQGDNAKGNKTYDLLIRLKLAQLKSVKENFILAHTDLPPTHPVRVKENKRVGDNQAALSAKTEEVVQSMIQDGYPANMVDLLRQSEPFMDDAGKKILATQNAPALVPQQKALNLIVEVEKFFHKIMGQGSALASYNPDDPFQDKQKHDMKPRGQAPAGELETLVKNQTHLSQDLQQNPADSSGTSPANATPSPATTANNGATLPAGAPAPGPAPDPNQPASQAVDPFGPDADKGSFAERQTRVLQGIEVLQNGNTVFPDAVVSALATAQKDAASSLRQLGDGHNDAAQEPAAAAAHDLQLALKAMNDAGNEETKQDLADAQRRLNALADKLRDVAQTKPPDTAKQLMDIALEVHQVQQNLETAADHQQEAGSAQGAQQLSQLAAKLQQQDAAHELAAMSKNGLDSARAAAVAEMLASLAGQAVHGLTPGPASAQDYAALINALQRTRANLEHLAAKAGTAPGQRPGPEDGQHQGQDQAAGNQAGSHPDGQGQPTGQGQQPGKGPGQMAGQGQQGQGQQPGQGAGQQPGQSPGQGQTMAQEKGQGQGQQPGNSSGANGQDSQGSGNGANGQPSPDGTGGDNPNGQGSGGASGMAGGGGEGSSPLRQTDQPVNAKAYHEVLQDLKNQAQQTAELTHNGDANQLLEAIVRYEHDGDNNYRQVSDFNVTKFFADIQQPLDKTILDLEALEQHAQRDEIVKTPDLDDTPLPYRSAVSDYFEEVSRDYHPATPPPAPPPPDPDTKSNP